MKMGTEDKRWEVAWPRALLHWECRWASKRWAAVPTRKLYFPSWTFPWNLGKPEVSGGARCLALWKGEKAQ